MADGKDKYGRTVDAYGRVVRGAGAQEAAEESKINNAGAGGLGGLAARAKAKASPTPDAGKGTAIPAGGLSEAQRKMAEEEAKEEEARKARKKAPIKPRM